MRGSTTSVCAMTSAALSGGSVDGMRTSKLGFCARTSPANAVAIAISAETSSLFAGSPSSTRMRAAARRNGGTKDSSSSTTRASPRSRMLIRPSGRSSCSTIVPAPAMRWMAGCPRSSGSSPRASATTASARWVARQWRVMAR